MVVQRVARTIGERKLGSKFDRVGVVGSVWDSSCVERLSWCGEEGGLGMKRLIALLSVKGRRRRHETEVCGERCSRGRGSEVWRLEIREV